MSTPCTLGLELAVVLDDRRLVEVFRVDAHERDHAMLRPYAIWVAIAVHAALRHTEMRHQTSLIQEAAKLHMYDEAIPHP